MERKIGNGKIDKGTEDIGKRYIKPVPEVAKGLFEYNSRSNSCAPSRASNRHDTISNYADSMVADPALSRCNDSQNSSNLKAPRNKISPPSIEKAELPCSSFFMNDDNFEKEVE